MRVPGCGPPGSLRALVWAPAQPAPPHSLSGLSSSRGQDGDVPGHQTWPSLCMSHLRAPLADAVWSPRPSPDWCGKALGWWEGRV